MAARMRIRLLTHVHGELSLPAGRQRFDYGPGTHTAWTDSEEAVFAHLIHIGMGKPVARRRRRQKED